MNISQMLSHWKAVEFVNVSDELRRFRLKLESDAGAPIERIEVNAAELLSDLCEHLQLGAAQHDAILGPQAVEYLTALMETPVRLAAKH